MPTPENIPTFTRKWSRLAPDEALQRWERMRDHLDPLEYTPELASRIHALAMADLEGLDLDRANVLTHMGNLIAASNPERALKIYALALKSDTRRASLVTTFARYLTGAGAAATGIMLLVVLVKWVWVSLPF